MFENCVNFVDEFKHEVEILICLFCTIMESNPKFFTMINYHIYNYRVDGNRCESISWMKRVKQREILSPIVRKKISFRMVVVLELQHRWRQLSHRMELPLDLRNHLEEQLLLRYRRLRRTFRKNSSYLPRKGVNLHL